MHGNVNTYNFDASDLTYRSAIIEAWTQRAQAIRLCVIFSFAGRYLSLIDKANQMKVEHIMLDNFGHLPAVQSIYS